MIITINLVIRFFLELIMLGAIGYWGWVKGNGIFKIILPAGLLLITAVIWFTFAVPDDPSRSGNALIPIPGIVRLLLELGLFAIATAIFYSLIDKTTGIIFGCAVIINYGIAYDRLLWMIKK
ncbi:MAG: YrdB family protein [Chloroflexi bacterium]|nr:YrdB family protein [Chloroflexota bacterium]